MQNDIIMLETLMLRRYKDKLVVVSDKETPKEKTGETFRHKERLKKSGFKWDPNINAWTIYDNQLQHAQEVLQLANQSPMEKFITKLEELPELVLGAENLSKKDELAQKIEGFISELSTAVDAAAASDMIRKFMEFNTRFHGYSWHNMLLIYLQRPDATKVAGFKQWEEKFHRRVKKGAKGISILAPIVKKIDEPNVPPSATPTPQGEDGGEKTERKYIRYMAVTVFDISDTEPIDERGNIPEKPSWHGSDDPNEKAEELFICAQEMANNIGVKVTSDSTSGTEQGWAREDHINLTSTIVGVNKAATIIHEIAHTLLHFKKTSPFYVGDESKENLSYAAGELQAESVSFIVIRYYGLPVDHQANYLALWKGNKEAIQKNVAVIKKCADFIITEIDKIYDEKKKSSDANPTIVQESHYRKYMKILMG